MLQFKTYRIKLRRKPYISVNIRELNRVPSIKYLSYIHWTDNLYYIKPSLL